MNFKKHKNFIEMNKIIVLVFFGRKQKNKV